MAKNFILEEQASRILKSYRVKLGLEQSEVAEKLGVSRLTYWKYENKPYNLPIDKLLKVIEVLDGDINDFVCS